MNNEPLAWMSKHNNQILTTNKLWIKEAENAGVDNWIPLYTHPAKCRCCNGYGLVGNIEDTVDCPLCHGEGFENHPAKTEDEGKVCARCGAIAYDPVITQTAKILTNEEIIKTMVQFDVYSSDDQCLVEAGRAIIRKAQE